MAQGDLGLHEAGDVTPASCYSGDRSRNRDEPTDGALGAWSEEIREITPVPCYSGVRSGIRDEPTNGALGEWSGEIKRDNTRLILQ